jgi:serine phosphatase RsbU (regulator of sigma subunit)
VIYTDGIIEATNEQGEEFSERRLLDFVRASRSSGVRSILAAVLGAVQDFSQGEQADDLTLVIACGC